VTGQPTALRLAVLGDSIGFGEGATRPEDRPAARLSRALEDRGSPVTTKVLAVPGARSADLRGQVDRAVTWHPDIAVVVIGANDLGHRVPPAQAARDLGDAVRRLREAGADVVVAPAPDLSVVPQVPEAYRALIKAGSEKLRAQQVEAVVAAGGRVADRDGATSTAFRADASLFSGDDFHPSSAGYAVIADALLPEVLAVVDDR
jgi:lysophospholipase L1-like esterase